MVRRVETEIPLGETITLREDTNTAAAPLPRPLIFLHGALGSGEQLRGLSESFRGERAVFAPDFPGHGKRAGEESGFSIGVFADDIRGFLDRERIETADIFGYSMGGYVGLHLALHHPARVGRVMTLGTKFAWDPATAEKEASRLDPAVLQSKAPAFAGQLRERHGAAWETVLRSTARMMRELGSAPALTDANFRSIPHDVLVMVGDRDTMVSIVETRGAADALPAGESLVVPGWEHPFERIDAGELARHMRTFYSQVQKQ